MDTYISKLASAIVNDIVGGLRGYHTNLSLSTELIEDEIIEERLQVLKEYSLKGILPLKDLYISINCIPVDCMSIEKCPCDKSDCQCDDTTDGIAHFEIPQIVSDYGSQSIDYIGSTDKQLPFIVYTSLTALRYSKYKKRGKNKPYVWIDTTPNKNGMYDCFVFNAPLLKQVSVSAIFKDLRQLIKYNCCIDILNSNPSFIDTEVKKRIIEKKIRYYRQLSPLLKPNDLTYTVG